jgi:YidC/Oxa1 family membrane protein insertase
MEDQGKRLLLAVGLITIVFFVYTQFFARPQQAPPAETPPATTENTPAEPAPVVPPSSGPPAPVADAPCDPTKDQGIVWDDETAITRFSRCGGAISAVELKGSQWTEGEGDKQRPLNLVRTSENPALYPLQVQVTASKPGSVDTNEARTPVIPERAAWQESQGEGGALVFRWVGAGLEVTKTYRPTGVPHAFTLETIVKNTGEKRVLAFNLSLFGHQDPQAKEPGMFTYAPPAWSAACFADGKVRHDKLHDVAAKGVQHTVGVKWAGLDQKYFLMAAAPTDKETYVCENAGVLDTGVLRSELRAVTPVVLQNGESLARNVVVYVGPKKLDLLERVEEHAKTDLGFTEAVDLGWFSFIARPMLSLLKVFYGWTANWGIAIILLTVVVKLLTLYWTHKSMKSMKAMSKLKPKMDELKEKYGEDKQRFQTEVMNLYKTHNINPLGGCLPILLQMPIWFALYQTLGSAAELYRAPFFGWLTDMTAPDPYFIVPVTLTALMFLQAKLQPAAVDSAQQKMMMYMMPIMFGVFSLFFPSGLGVYIMTNTVLGMGHQLYLNKTDPGVPAPAKVVETTAAASAPAPPADDEPAPSNKPARSNKRKNNAAKKAAKA